MDTRPTSAWEKSEALSSQREGHALDLTTASNKIVDSESTKYILKLNNIKQNETKFEDFKFERPTLGSITALYEIIEACVSSRITAAFLRREGRRVMLQRLRTEKGMTREMAILEKPSALCARSMSSDVILTWGSEEIFDCPLKPKEMREDHLKMHKTCTADCYFWRLYNVARNGWRLPNMRFRVKKIMKNHPPFDYFGECSQASLSKQLEVAGAVEDAPDDEILHINPLLSVIRNSDLYRASAAGFNIVDESSLSAANAALTPIIKIRVCLDAGANGQNDAQPDFPFSYASINDAISMMTPGCYMAKLDLANMYLTLGLSLCSRKFFGFHDGNMNRRYKRMPFGAKLGAAVLSAFVAEALAIAAFYGIKTVINYMDDFFIVGVSYAECLFNLRLMIAILTRLGWTVAEDKTTLPSQSMTFIGVLLDSRSMTLSIEPEKAEAIIFKFSRAREELLLGRLKPSLLASLAGNCMWFSSVVTLGKIFTMPLFGLFRMIRRKKLQSAHSCDIETLRTFDKAHDWWIGTLRDWSKRTLVRSNVKVIPSQLIKDGIFLQQDAGDDGLGYFSALAEEEFKRIRWYGRTLSDAEETSSTYKELSTLVWALKSRNEWSNKLIVAVFDSCAAAFGINNGSSPSPNCMFLIEEVFMLCDERNITLVALWVPRSENTFADMLTHLCLHNRTTSAEGEFEL